MLKNLIAILWDMQKSNLSDVGNAKKPDWCIMGIAKTGLVL